MQHEFCYYCGDRKVRKDWERIGGTIGETHYVCHRKRCQKQQEVVTAKRRLQVRYTRALKACGHDLEFIRAQEKAIARAAPAELRKLEQIVVAAEERAQRKADKK